MCSFIREIRMTMIGSMGNRVGKGVLLNFINKCYIETKKFNFVHTEILILMYERIPEHQSSHSHKECYMKGKTWKSILKMEVVL